MILKAKTFTAFQIQNLDGFTTFLDGHRVQMRRFVPIDGGAEPISFGWTGYTDVMDTSFTECSPDLGEYLLFALRVDKRNVSSKVVQKYFAVAMKKELESKVSVGKVFLNRDRRREIK